MSRSLRLFVFTALAFNLAIVQSSFASMQKLMKDYSATVAKIKHSDDISGSVSSFSQPDFIHGNENGLNHFLHLVHKHLGSLAAELGQESQCFTGSSIQKKAKSMIDDLFASYADTADTEEQNKFGVLALKTVLSQEIQALGEKAIVCSIGTWDGGESSGSALTVYDPAGDWVYLFHLYSFN